MINTDIDSSLKNLYEQKVKEEKVNSSSFEGFPAMDKFPLSMGMNLCRVVEIPLLCHNSLINCDDGKTRLFNFPSIEENSEFILYRIITHILQSQWLGKDKDGKHRFEYPVKEKFPDIYQMIYNNGNLMEGEYGPNGWGSWKKYSGKYRGCASNTTCMVNVISRNAFTVKAVKEDSSGSEVEEIKTFEADWCAKNNHTLLLSRESKTGFFNGAPVSVFNALIKSVWDKFGNFAKFDVAIERLKDDPWYQVYKADTLENRKDIQPYVKKGDLTDAEKAYETYDIKELVKPSAYSFIYNNLKNKINLIDDALGTHYLLDLEKEVEKENSGKSVGEKVKIGITLPEPKIEQPVKEETVVASEKVEPKKKERKIASPVSSSGDSLKKLAFTMSDGKSILDIIPENQRALIKGVSPDGKTFEFDCPTGELADCPICNKAQPIRIEDYCVYCGTSFSAI